MTDLIPRGLLPRGREFLNYFPAVVIQGARQVGKSTLAGMLVADRPHAVVSLDDPRERDAVAADPWAFVNQVKDGVLVIDEVQRQPDLLLTVKASIDRDRRPGRFILTGSSNILAAGGGDSLAGRAVDLPLRPWMPNLTKRETGRSKVGVVIELDDGRVLGIEVKASSTFRAEHFAGLAFLMDKLGDRFVAGVVLGTSDRGYQYADRLWGLPVSSLWEV